MDPHQFMLLVVAAACSPYTCFGEGLVVVVGVVVVVGGANSSSFSVSPKKGG
jgi:hypothetical protein